MEYLFEVNRPNISSPIQVNKFLPHGYSRGLNPGEKQIEGQRLVSFTLTRHKLVGNRILSLSDQRVASH